MQTIQNDAVMLQCPNDLCLAANFEHDKFCQQCGTFLTKRYLWAVGEGIQACQTGELVSDRYLLKGEQIFLDTKPGLLPEASYLEPNNAIKPYLRLFAYRLQIPQVFTLLPLKQGNTTTEILLLEQAPIIAGTLMPSLTSVWQDASTLRQLNWLWQIAQLWQPLRTENVASSLLQPQLLRVEGSLVRLLQLQLDTAVPTLEQLGEFWAQLVVRAKPSIAEFLAQLCSALKQGEVQSSEELITRLEAALVKVGRSQTRNFRISTYTDTGPSRQRNEDACYPPSGTTNTQPPEAKALVIVCDGIGGHEGGNVASNLAIETLQQQVQQLPLNDINLDATTLIYELENYIGAANDAISQRNDNENRLGRQRMGTTLVMAIGHLHEMHLAHVGDSRAYWITRKGCYQVTIDDDVASREARLGYALYRDALQQPAAGSLIQALGMSGSVHPTLQRFVLDEDSVFLLCSDGLSDYDLVDQCWETEILPILDGKVDVFTAGQRLVEIANTQNGHDNVTVGLIYCQVSDSEPEAIVPNSLATPTEVSVATLLAATNLAKDSPNAEFSQTTSTLNTHLLPSKGNQHRPLVAILLGLVLLLSLGGAVVAYLANQEKFSNFSGSTVADRRSPSPTLSVTQTPTSSSVTAANLSPGMVFKTKDIVLLSQIPNRQNQANRVNSILSTGSVVQVLGQQTTAQQENWLKLKVCSTPAKGTVAPIQLQQDNNIKTRSIQSSTTASKLPLLQSGDEGWIQAANIAQFLLPVTSVELTQLGKCNASTKVPARE